MRFDHIIVMSGDPAQYSEQLHQKYGFGAVQGPDLGGGLASMIIPLKKAQYIQVIYIDNLDQAWTNPFGQWLWGHRMSRLPEVLGGWVVEVDGLDQIAKRLKVKPVEQSVQWPKAAGGKMSRWRALAHWGFAAMPILVEYAESQSARAARLKGLFAEAKHEREPIEIAWVKTGAPQSDVQEWVSDRSLDVKFSPGWNALNGVGIRTEGDSVLVLS